MDYSGGGIGWMLALLMVVSGCAALNETPTVEVDGMDALIQHINRSGVVTQYQGPATTYWISTTGEEFIVGSGGTLVVYQHKSDAAATLDMARLKDQNSVVSGPHIYNWRKLIVIYVGDDPRVHEALTEALGAQSA